MKRPAFQFYPADWKSNSKLRRCSEAARGAWMDVLCLLHDSDDYGVIRWPLADIARAAGVPMKLLKELAEKDVLKGGEAGCEPYIYTPRHGRTEGDPVELVAKSESPCWYCSRFVRDEHVRQKRGDSTRFGEGNNPQNTSPNPSPKGGLGAPEGDGSTSSSSSSSSNTPYSPPRGTGSKPPKKSDNIPTTPQALRIAMLFRRRPTTPWSDKEVRAYKKLGKIDPEDLEVVCRYTESERAKGDEGRHRRDLATFLNNFTGELDRAREKPINGHHAPKQIQFID